MNVASSLGTSDGGWLKSASITPRTGADATSNPATTAVPSPSLPDRWTTLTRRVRESSSATSPVPSGELSSTITISRTTPCASQAAKTALTSSAIRSRSLYVGTTIERSGIGTVSRRRRLHAATINHATCTVSCGPPAFLQWPMSEGPRRGYIAALVAALLVGAVLRGAWPTSDPPTQGTVGIVWHDEGAWVHNARNRALWGTWRTGSVESDVHRAGVHRAGVRRLPRVWRGHVAGAYRAGGIRPFCDPDAFPRARGSGGAPGRRSRRRAPCDQLRLRDVESRGPHGVHDDGVHRRQLGSLRMGAAASRCRAPGWYRSGSRLVHEGLGCLFRSRDCARRGLHTC